MNRTPFHSAASTVLLIALLGLTLAAAAFADNTFAGNYGAELTLEETTPIDAILDAPADFVGKDVRVEGTVRAVCAKAGCWLEIGDAEGRALQVKVEDGVIVFPMEAVGSHVAAQGTVEVIDLGREEYIGWQQHVAEETGQDFDASQIGDGPYQIVRIAGHGARIGG